MPNDGLLRYLSYFNQERVIICSPEALSEMLVQRPTDFVRSQSLKYTFGRLIGLGLILSHGDMHRMHRRILSPAFSFRHIKSLVPAFWAKTAESVREINKLCGENGYTVMNMADIATRTTLDIIFLAGMGHNFNALADPESPLAVTYNSITTVQPQDRTLTFVGRFIPLRYLIKIPFPRTRYIDLACEAIRLRCRDLIAMRRREIDEKKTDLGNDVLTLVLQNEEKMDQRAMEDQLMTFLIAGHETSTGSLTWATYLLARHPDMQERLRDQIRASIPSIASGAPVTADDIDNLPYLQAFCAETLRYFSPIPLTTRQTLEDTTLLGHPIPRGSHLVWVPWATNLDPRFWGEDSYKFNPDRWLTDDGNGQRVCNSGGANTNFAMMTFGQGPRDCIGKSFAKRELACILAGWVSKFRFELVRPELADESKLTINKSVTVRPLNVDLRVTVLPDY